jgi:hypothetical protein
MALFARGREAWTARRLREVIVLAVSLDARLIGKSLFSALFAMAMLWTVLTVRMVRLAFGPHGMPNAAASQTGR